jgi:hypothetical protein
LGKAAVRKEGSYQERKVSVFSRQFVVPASLSFTVSRVWTLNWFYLTHHPSLFVDIWMPDQVRHDGIPRIESRAGIVIPAKAGIQRRARESSVMVAVRYSLPITHYCLFLPLPSIPSLDRGGKIVDNPSPSMKGEVR